MDEVKRYAALFFRQRPAAPLQVAFIAPSSEIDSWARVPTKRTGNVRNFQRAEIQQHSDEVRRFFGKQDNSSPTAVVVGFDPIRAADRVKLFTSAGEVLDPLSVTGEMPQLGEIEVCWLTDPDPQTSLDLRSTILQDLPSLERYIYQELADISAGHVTEESFAAMLSAMRSYSISGRLDSLEFGDLSETDEEIGEDEARDDQLAEVLEGEIPPEVRSALEGLSPSPVQVVLSRLQFLARIQPPLLEELPDDQLRDLYREVADELKPAILIDGQHRVMGTRKMSIPFLVTALPHAEWPELAFQFIVTNRTARRVAESLLISIVGQSLSKDQRSSIEERLREANIRVGLIEAVMRVHEDEQSPFYSMLAFGLKKERGFIDAAAMRGKVIHLWYERNSPVRELFAHLCQGKSQQDKTEYWKAEELWFDAFIQFWSAVQKRYEGTQVFSTELVERVPVSKLMSATVLKIFQEAVLSYLLQHLKQKENTENVPISMSLPNTAEFAMLVTNSLRPLTPEFFTDWQLSGFDGSKGARDDLSGAIKLVLGGTKTVARLRSGANPHRLFKRPEA